MQSPSEVLDSLKTAFPLVGEMGNTPQDPVWHAEGDVRTHTLMVLELALQRHVPDPDSFALACALHDIGKTRTTRTQWRDSEGRECVVSPKHASYGRSYLYPRMHRLREIVSQPQVDLICSLVGYHHHVKSACGVHDKRGDFEDNPLITEGEQARMLQLARISNLQDLFHLETCDTLGRVSLDIPAEWSDEDKVWWLYWFQDMAEFYGVWEAPPFKGWREQFADAFESEGSEFVEKALCKATYDYAKKKIFTPEEGISRAYEWRKHCPSLTLLCGPPGSGKSSVASRYEHVVSLDQLREEIVGDRSCQKKNGQVRQEAKQRLQKHLASGHDVCFDATSLTRDQRRTLLSLAHQYKAATRIIGFAIDPDILRNRNQRREHRVPDLYLDEAIAKYEFPAESEAHRLTVIDGYGERDLGSV